MATAMLVRSGLVSVKFAQLMRGMVRVRVREVRLEETLEGGDVRVR